MLGKTYILGVGITTTRKDKILESISDVLQEGRVKYGKGSTNDEKVVIFTPNPEQLSVASRNPEMSLVLNQAQVALPDGVGLVAASRLLGKPIYAKISGINFIGDMLEYLSRLPDRQAKRPVVIGCLGGQKQVAVEAGNCLQEKYSWISIGYASEAYDKEKMMHSDIDILFVGLGFPKQEKWILEHKDEIPARVIMAVGGSLDFLSGRVTRAPEWIQKVGLEWLFRLMIQPWRFFRQLRLLHFSALILVEALTSRVKKLKV